MNRLPGFVRQHIAALRLLLVFTVVTGIIYPVVMVAIAQVAFHNQANGSLVSYHSRVVGSSLLCQEFVDRQGQPAAAVLPAAPVRRDPVRRQERLRLRPQVLLGVQPWPEQPRSGDGHQAAAAADRGV